MTRLSININDDTAEVLRRLAAKKQTTVTEILRRSVSAYKFIEDECVFGDKTLKTVDRNGDSWIVTIL